MRCMCCVLYASCASSTVSFARQQRWSWPARQHRLSRDRRCAATAPSPQTAIFCLPARDMSIRPVAAAAQPQPMTPAQQSRDHHAGPSGVRRSWTAEERFWCQLSSPPADEETRVVNLARADQVSCFSACSCSVVWSESMIEASVSANGASPVDSQFEPIQKPSTAVLFSP
jgi:hypothetical protein